MTSLPVLAKPFIKWVGGKSQIITLIVDMFPKNMNNYYEPFLGGGSVLFALLTCKNNGFIKVDGNIYASDLNSNIIALYRNIQTKPDLFIDAVKILIEEFKTCKKEEPLLINRKATTIDEALTSEESYYYWIRNNFNKLADKTSIAASAMILFLNKTCFRGIYRESPKGGFNVPFGNNKNPSIINEEHIKQISVLIKDVIFRDCNFTNALSNIKDGDFVYLDPPYVPQTSTSFVSYTKDGFKMEEHLLLFEKCNEMTGKNVKMLLSNSEVKLVLDSFPLPLYNTNIISCKRSIHSKSPNTKTNEVLITNYF